MILTEMCMGEEAVLLVVPAALIPFSFRSGGRIRLIFSRPHLSVVDTEGARFALCSELAQQIIVVRAPT